MHLFADVLVFWFVCMFEISLGFFRCVIGGMFNTSCYLWLFWLLILLGLVGVIRFVA